MSWLLHQNREGWTIENADKRTLEKRCWSQAVTSRSLFFVYTLWKQVRSITEICFMSICM